MAKLKTHSFQKRFGRGSANKTGRGVLDRFNFWSEDQRWEFEQMLEARGDHFGQRQKMTLEYLQLGPKRTGSLQLLKRMQLKGLDGGSGGLLSPGRNETPAPITGNDWPAEPYKPNMEVHIRAGEKKRCQKRVHLFLHANFWPNQSRLATQRKQVSCQVCILF